MKYGLPVLLILFPLLSLGQGNVDLSVDDHLEPQPGYLADMNHNMEYLPYVRETLMSKISDSPLARVVVLPTFAAEYMVSVEQNRKTGACMAVLAVAQRSILNDETKEGIEAIVTRVSMNPELGKKLSILFRAATARVGYLKYKTWGTDGTVYHFSSFAIGDGIRSGSTWAPRPGTRMHNLVQIAELLQKFVQQNGSTAIAQQLSDRCETLTKRINSL